MNTLQNSIGSPKEAIAGGIYASTFDYLQPEVNRPDIFEERNSIRSGIYKGKSKQGTTFQIISTICLVILSGFIFITIVGWATVLQSYIDYKIINPVIESVYISRLWYAVIVTIITVITLSIALFLYYKYKHYYDKYQN